MRWFRTLPNRDELSFCERCLKHYNPFNSNLGLVQIEIPFSYFYYFTNRNSRFTARAVTIAGLTD